MGSRGLGGREEKRRKEKKEGCGGRPCRDTLIHMTPRPHIPVRPLGPIRAVLESALRATGPRPRPLRYRWFNSRVTDTKQKRAAPEAGAALFCLVEAAGVEPASADSLPSDLHMLGSIY